MRDLSQNPQADMPVTSEFGMDSTIDIERPSSQQERGLLNNLLKRHTAQMTNFFRIMYSSFLPGL